jgi:hypothetical protein
MAAWLGTHACGQNPVIVPVRNFAGPTDMALVCVQKVGPAEDPQLTGRPMTFCHAPDVKDPRVDLQARPRGTFGLVTNTGRGELAVVDLDRNRLVDLLPGIPGFNMLPVGAVPEAVAISTDGCRAVTANRGSCDLGFIETSRLLSVAMGNARATADGGATRGPVAASVQITTRSGALSARPGAITFVPQNVAVFSAPPPPAPAPAPDLFCSDAGAASVAGRQPWRALVTFPGCELVALVDLPSGRLVDSVYLRSGGLVPAGDDPVCPVECGAPTTAAMDAGEDAGDAGAGDAGAGTGAEATGTGITAPTSLAVLPDASRIYVGARNLPAIAALQLDPAGRLLIPASGGLIPLHEGAVGTTRLRLSVDWFRPGAESGVLGAFVGDFPAGGPEQFLYAIAQDGTVRVVDVGARRFPPSFTEVECEVSVDSLTLAARPGATLAACDRYVEDPAARLPRKIFARGPGLAVPPGPTAAGLPTPVPVDVAFAQLQRGQDMTNPLEAADFVGAFAYLLLSNGAIHPITLVEGNATLREIQLTPTLKELPPPHSFRNTLVGAAQPDNRLGPPRLPGAPVASLSTNEIPFARRAVLDREQVPRVEGFETENTSVHPLAASGAPLNAYAYFPRPNETRDDQLWSGIWEGELSGTRRSSGVFQAPASPVAIGAGVVTDAGAAFCAAGAQPGDVVRLFGCGEDTDCGRPEDWTCIRSAAAAPGLCVRAPQAAALEQTCGRLLRSRLRWEATAVASRRIEFALKPDERVLPSVIGCADLCGQEQEYAGFACLPVTPGGPARCVRTCANDDDCRPGAVCEDVGSPAGPLCVEAPRLDPACVSERTSYAVQAGKSFLIRGSLTPSFATSVEVAGQCQPLVNRNPRLADRIPLSAPRCPAITDQPAGQSTAERAAATEGNLVAGPQAATVAQNPCLYLAPNADDETDAQPHARALFEGPELRFVLTNLEQPFGDGVAFQFGVVGGMIEGAIEPSDFAPTAVPSRLIASPIEVLRDEDELPNSFYPYLYVVDAGRLDTRNRGQILRVDTERPGYDSSRSSRTFDVQ